MLLQATSLAQVILHVLCGHETLLQANAPVHSNLQSVDVPHFVFSQAFPLEHLKVHGMFGAHVLPLHAPSLSHAKVQRSPAPHVPGEGQVVELHGGSAPLLDDALLVEAPDVLLVDDVPLTTPLVDVVDVVEDRPASVPPDVACSPSLASGSAFSTPMTSRPQASGRTTANAEATTKPVAANLCARPRIE